MPKLEFFFDCSSPWTYLGFEGLQDLVDLYPELEVDYKPILVGGVFNTVNPSVYASRENPVPAKQAHTKKDMKDWADLQGIEIGQPPVFPVNSVKAMRGAFVALEQDKLVAYVRAVFKKYWTELKDISQDEVMKEVLAEVGMDEADYFEKITSQPYKDLLKDTTQELIDRGGFGSPTMFLNGDDMYFGNDRLQLIEARLVSSSND